MSQDGNKSIDQLIGMLSISNVSVPRLDKFRDVFEFINEFETVTATLTDEQQLKTLIKAFPPGRLRSWYEREIKPLIVTNPTWSVVKAKIIAYYSDREDRDRYFTKLHAMKFNPDGQDKLFVFVEDMLYAFSKAFGNTSDDVKIRYVKSVLPPTVAQCLSQNTDYNTPTDLVQFLKAIRQFDMSRANAPAKSDTEKPVNTAELLNIIQKGEKRSRENNENNRCHAAASAQRLASTRL